MYKTNSTNSLTSAMQAESLFHFQHDFFNDEHDGHNPDQLVIDQVFSHYHEALKSQVKLVQRFNERKINPEFIKQFKIGFSDRTLGFELQSSKCLIGSKNRGHLQRLGLCKGTGHEFFQGALVIPYSNDNGKTIGAYGRRPRHQSRSPAYHLYWNSQKTSFFNVTEQPLSKNLIVCKSALDTLTLLTAGFENVVGTMGAQGFNDVQLSRLQNDDVNRVFIAFDNTPSANHYAFLMAQALDAIGIQCYHVKLPLGLDVNSFAMTQSNVTNAFRKLIDESVIFKQGYAELISSSKNQWFEQLNVIEDCVQFYLAEGRSLGKSSKTLNASRIHLDRFREFCQTIGVEQLEDLSSAVLESYQHYLQSEKNIFTGNVISLITQIERMDAVTRMLNRLHYFGVITEPLTFVTSCGPIH